MIKIVELESGKCVTAVSTCTTTLKTFIGVGVTRDINDDIDKTVRVWKSSIGYHYTYKV